MTPAEFQTALIALYGERGWQSAAASALGVDRVTIWRWCSGSAPLPGPAVAAVRCFLDTKAKRRPR